MKQILITYDPETADSGGPLDLFGYLENELNNRSVICQISEVLYTHPDGGEVSRVSSCEPSLDQGEKQDLPDCRETITLGIAAAREVVDAWTKGDLAGAVNMLEAWADNAEGTL